MILGDSRDCSTNFRDKFVAYGPPFKIKQHTDRNFVVISSQQVLHFDHEVKYYEEHFSKSNFYILVIRFAHSK